MSSSGTLDARVKRVVDRVFRVSIQISRMHIEKYLIALLRKSKDARDELAIDLRTYNKFVKYSTT